MVETVRTNDEIQTYLDEAFDKVWFMRSNPCDDEGIEASRQERAKQILNKYDDIPIPNEWEDGYWNGILGALRWVLGDEKNFLDT